MIKILWADDEIDLLRPHIIFLEQKGYSVTPVVSGTDAIEACSNSHFDVVFLDENMPGLSGLETLLEIKKAQPALPVVMITKSEEENIMEQAIGQKISDYLIKPVNPNQILMSIKKVVHAQEIITEKTTSGYQSEFMRIGMQINDSMSAEDWQKVYNNLIFWEMQLDEAGGSMDEMLQMQKTEANNLFAKYIRKNYENWIESGKHPVMSPDIFKTKVFPLLDKGEKVFFILIDNLRQDQWRIIQREIGNLYNFDSDDTFYSILPTATQYSRNAIFSGLMPAQIRKMYPDLWVDEEEDEGKNLNEEALVKTQIERFRKKYTFSYNKINTNQAGEKYNESVKGLLGNDLNVVVFNFVDMLSHARTEVKLFRELAPDEAAYRSLVQSWFRHSSISDLFKILAEHKIKIVLTTDHGSIRVKNAIKVVGDKNTNVNLRYKVGKNLAYNKKEVFSIVKPDVAGLPSPNLSSTYIFAEGQDFIAYPNNYNYYVQYYKDTFQHGGVSLEEMIIPVITMSPKGA
ncbi:MAG: bifunctional response regulator/alkaline phosphatase family protein [Paludibacteraceae bacterium]|nr:bifunctional response regulator/alkaline phosphatase family protein [Paludibacteraceae bacterium]MDY6426619.1 bifunctional response regulator/alkaline phosphatase family protein [Bacteroidales bacterium]